MFPISLRLTNQGDISVNGLLNGNALIGKKCAWFFGGAFWCQPVFIAGSCIWFFMSFVFGRIKLGVAAEATKRNKNDS